MIRINLLPFRAARKRENVRRQIGIYIAAVLIVLAATLIYSQRLFSDLSKKVEEKNKINAELGKYQKTLAAIKQLEAQIKEINTKLGVIKTLEEGKSVPVLLLGELADAVPKDKLWLTSLSESGGTLRLSGTAMDNATVALFMNNLKSKEHITSVELQSAKIRDISQYRLKVSDFSLTCKTYAHKKAEPAKPKRRKGRRR